MKEESSKSGQNADHSGLGRHLQKFGIFPSMENGWVFKHWSKVISRFLFLKSTPAATGKARITQGKTSKEGAQRGQGRPGPTDYGRTEHPV